MVLSEYMKEHPDIMRHDSRYCRDSLTNNYLQENQHIKAAQSSDDLGVVVSWNIK